MSARMAESDVLGVLLFRDRAGFMFLEFQHESDGAVIGERDFHVGLENAAESGDALLAAQLDRALIKQLGSIRGFGMREARTATSRAVAQQRELRDDEMRSADVFKRAIHFSCLVLENAELADFRDELCELGFIVAFRDAQQRENAAFDSRDFFFIDDYACLFYPLDYRAHIGYCSDAMPALQRLKTREIQRLVAWYEKNQRDFPWRKNPDPYWVWLAEIMSQQTQMATLVPYFYRFIERFPNVEALARASEDDVLAAWAGLGYYSRARNVHRAARMIVDELKSEFPRTLEGLLELPGVGPYTAAAIASQCFQVAEPVWDGNVIRVCSRLEARADALVPAFRAEMQDALRVKMAGHCPSAFNQALMELGATVCTPKAAACERCPISGVCEALRLEAVGRFPPPKPRKENIELRCRVQVRIRSEQVGEYEVFVQRRRPGQWFEGLWDFPSELGGAKLPVEAFSQDLSRAGSIGEVHHQITHHKIFLMGVIQFEKPMRSTRAKALNEDGAWIALDRLVDGDSSIALSTTARKMIKLLLRRIETFHEFS